MANRNNTATGLRIMNASGNFRVASGQTLDMNNQESMRQMAMNAGENLDSTDDVFTRLAKKKAELAAKRTQLANAAEIQAEEAKAKAEYEANIVPLTAGSVISGTLINGMYVPTGSSSSNEPMPALFRVKKEAIMPNYFVSDEVVECVIVAGSRPAIESIRVIFRASTITCIREDGRATEDSIRATSTGPDGVTGVPAKLISRNSEMLAKTAMAGFLNGLTEIFSQTSLEVNEEDGVYAISGGDLAKLGGSAALGGAGEALTRLADYYMTLADKMQPTLLVNPGIEVDFLVTSMSQLDFNKSDAKVK
jgi:conjugal transfer pilus assembly protein TraB